MRRYQANQLPAEDSLDLLMPKDCALAEKQEIHFSDFLP